jgi:hypothetical protein
MTYSLNRSLLLERGVMFGTSLEWLRSFTKYPQYPRAFSTIHLKDWPRKAQTAYVLPQDRESVPSISSHSDHHLYCLPVYFSGVCHHFLRWSCGQALQLAGNFWVPHDEGATRKASIDWVNCRYCWKRKILF